jgi:hypothetical protein
MLRAPQAEAMVRRLLFPYCRVDETRRSGMTRGVTIGRQARVRTSKINSNTCTQQTRVTESLSVGHRDDQIAQDDRITNGPVVYSLAT